MLLTSPPVQALTAGEFTAQLKSDAKAFLAALGFTFAGEVMCTSSPLPQATPGTMWTGDAYVCYALTKQQQLVTLYCSELRACWFPGSCTPPPAPR